MQYSPVKKVAPKPANEPKGPFAQISVVAVFWRGARVAGNEIFSRLTIEFPCGSTNNFLFETNEYLGRL